MPEVLAAVHGDRCATAVTAVAQAMADVVHGRVRRIVLNVDRRTGGYTERLLRELALPGALLAVLARDVPYRLSWRPIVHHADKPVVLVPSIGATDPVVISRVLVPLDGTAEAGAAVREAVTSFARAGVDIIVLHVFDAATVPRFWDQAAHARQEWEEDFRAQQGILPASRIELRSGAAADRVIHAAAALEDADLIALGWPRDISPGRARTVRQAVSASLIPVMLVPLKRRIEHPSVLSAPKHSR